MRTRPRTGPRRPLKEGRGHRWEPQGPRGHPPEAGRAVRRRHSLALRRGEPTTEWGPCGPNPKGDGAPGPARSRRFPMIASRLRFAFLIAAGSAVLLSPQPLEAQEAAVADRASPRPSVEAVRHSRWRGDPDRRLPGRGVWELANPITDFRQQDPVEGGTPSEPRRSGFCTIGQALYIGAMFYDSEPERDPGAPARAKRGAGDGRPLHVDPRHLPGRPHGVLLRDQPGRPDGRRSDRAAAAGGGGINKRGTGSGRSAPGSSERLVGRDPDPLLHPELRPEPMPGESTSSERSDGRARRSSGADGGGTRASSARSTPESSRGSAGSPRGSGSR
jgi:hypothetical protein